MINRLLLLAMMLWTTTGFSADTGWYLPIARNYYEYTDLLKSTTRFTTESDRINWLRIEAHNNLLYGKRLQSGLGYHFSKRYSLVLNVIYLPKFWEYTDPELYQTGETYYKKYYCTSGLTRGIMIQPVITLWQLHPKLNVYGTLGLATLGRSKKPELNGQFKVEGLGRSKEEIKTIINQEGQWERLKVGRSIEHDDKDDQLQLEKWAFSLHGGLGIQGHLTENITVDISYLWTFCKRGHFDMSKDEQGVTQYEPPPERFIDRSKLNLFRIGVNLRF